MTTKAVEFTTPPGQLVWGSLYEPRDTDFDGNPLVYKKGVDAGKPYVMYDFGVAVPKTQAHFANEPGWGQLAWATAHAAFAGGDKSPAMAPEFSWKITDGDSTRIPPKSKSKVAPCDREGHKGCWILKFSSQFAPKIYDASRNVENPPALDTPNAVLPGDYVQVAGTMAGNTGNSPGIYLNHAAVGLKGYGKRIESAGVDVKGKFGGALPPGASLTPPAGFVAPAVPAAPALSAALPATAPAPYVALPAAVPPAAAPTAVVPAPAIMGIPTIPTVPAAPAATAMPPQPPATRPSHKGFPIDSYLARGWTIDQLRVDGYTG
jgi:hypothetical protein